MRIKRSGIHRVRRKLADGTTREHHYAWRGGPKFWSSGTDVAKDSPEYLAAYAEAAPKADSAKGKFREVILKYLDSGEFKALAPRTQKDIRTSINHKTNGIDVKFGGAPLVAFGDHRIRKQALDWRDKIGGKVGDDRIRHLQQIVGFGHDRGMISENRLTRIKSVYRSNRAEVMWTDEEIDRFCAGAPPHVARILVAATETGLRPGDLAQLSRFQIQTTRTGRRIVLNTSKSNRKRIVSIPVTQRMSELIDATPPGQSVFIVNKRGMPYKHANYLGDAVSDWRDKINARHDAPVLTPDVRLYDARGTAATRLLNAGAEMREIATAMGWSIKKATDVIERYIALHPDMTDALGAKLERLRANEAGSKL